jgi:hypothetical protein
MLAITRCERITRRVLSFMRTTERYETMPMAPRNASATAKPRRTLRSVATCRLPSGSRFTVSRRRVSSPNSTLTSTPTSTKNTQWANDDGVENPKLSTGATKK